MIELVLYVKLVGKNYAFLEAIAEIRRFSLT